MRKAIIALAAIATFAALAPAPADAGCRGCAVGAGVIGGLAAGAIIGSALAGPPAPAPVYVAPAPVYAPPPVEYVDEPVCHIERQQFWDGYAYRCRRIQVCD